MARDYGGTFSDYLHRTSAPATGTPLTMAMWTQTLNGTIVSVVDEPAGTAPANYFRIYGGFGPNNSRAEAADGTTTSYASAGRNTDSEWHHYCGVFASSTSRTMYEDGTAGSEDTTSVAPTGIDNFVSGKLGVSSERMSGNGAEICLWDVALTAAEITALASGVCPRRIRPLNLKLYIPMFGVHSPELDYSGNGNDLTIAGTVSALSYHATVTPRFMLDRGQFFHFVGGGGQEVTPSAASATWSIGAPTVTAGPVTLTPSAASATWAIGAPTATAGPVSATPGAAVGTWAVAAPTLTAGGVTLTPSAASATWAIGAPTVTAGPVTLTPSPAVATWAVGSPTVSSGTVLSPGAASATWAIAAPTLTAGGVTLTPSAASATWAAAAPTLTAGGVTLTPSAAVATWAIGSPTVGTGVVVTPSPAVATWAVGVPTLAAGAVSLSPGAAAATWAIASPVVVGGLLTPVDVAIRSHILTDVPRRSHIAEDVPRRSYLES